MKSPDYVINVSVATVEKQIALLRVAGNDSAEAVMSRFFEKYIDKSRIALETERLKVEAEKRRKVEGCTCEVIKTKYGNFIAGESNCPVHGFG